MQHADALSTAVAIGPMSCVRLGRPLGLKIYQVVVGASKGLR